MFPLIILYYNNTKSMSFSKADLELLALAAQVERISAMKPKPTPEEQPHKQSKPNVKSIKQTKEIICDFCSPRNPATYKCENTGDGELIYFCNKCYDEC